MFQNPNISTLRVLEQHIQTLEFAFSRVYPTIDYNLKAFIEKELGNAYHAKMQIIKSETNDSNSHKTTERSENYPSKLNKETVTDENGTTTGPSTPNMEVPQLWEYHI